MCPLGEVAHTVPLVYQPTQLPGGTMTRPEGALFPLPPYTVYDCKTWGIAMSKSIFDALFSFAHSCCFLCAISCVNYYAISTFDSNP